jgi:poly-gamma-glutamate system protein
MDYRIPVVTSHLNKMGTGRSLTGKEKLIHLGGVVSLVVITVAVILTGREHRFYYGQEEEMAFSRMKETVDAISEMGNLIGPELSDITTTTGDRAAKSTTLHPAFASLLVRLLRDAGVRPGDTIAVGCSGSFPGLLIAALAASEAMNIEPRIILSLGSSSFGASDPDFTILDIHMAIYEKGLAPFLPLAVSLGGDKDAGRDFEEGTRLMLTQKAADWGIPLVLEADLVRNRHLRDSIYFQGDSDRISAFINSGGGYANMGTSSLSLLLKPGIVRKTQMPPYESQGVIHDMLGKKIPVIHLLHIKGVATAYRIPWDSR